MTAQVPPDVERKGRQAVAGPAQGLVERLAERLGAAVSASAVYGAPAERDGVTVIPVAKVRWGFGGGGDTEGNGGGGGGVTATPVGYIEVSGSGATFRPIHQRTPWLATPAKIIAGGITARMILAGVRRIIRG